MTRLILCVLFNGVSVMSCVGETQQELNVKFCEYIETLVDDNSELHYEYTHGEETDCFCLKGVVELPTGSFTCYIGSMIENAGKYTVIWIGNEGWGLYSNLEKKIVGYTESVGIRDNWLRNN